MKMPPKTEQLSGAFLSLSAEELDAILEGVAALGYPKELCGIRLYLLDSLVSNKGETKSGPTLAETLQDFVEGNPDTVNKILQGAGVAGKTLLQKIVKQATST